MIRTLLTRIRQHMKPALVLTTDDVLTLERSRMLVLTRDAKNAAKAHKKS